MNPKKLDTRTPVINSQKPNIYGLMRRVPSLLSRNYRFRRYPPLSLVPKCILAVRVSRLAARNRQTPCRGIVGTTHRYVYLRVVPRNLLFTNSMFEEYRGVTSTYDFMTVRNVLEWRSNNSDFRPDRAEIHRAGYTIDRVSTYQ